jgi:hypothetical protein
MLPRIFLVVTTSRAISGTKLTNSKESNISAPQATPYPTRAFVINVESMYEYEVLDMTKCITRIIRLEGSKNFDDPLLCEILIIRSTLD